MRYKKMKLYAGLLLSTGLTWLQAQEAVPVTGGNASGSGGSAGYSVGQVVYTTITGTTGSVAQGVQQPYEISVVAALEETNGINLICSVYPNPVTDYLILKIDAEFPRRIQSLSFQLFDTNGKLLENKKLYGNETSILMSHFVPSVYFLKILADKEEVKTFKIIKN